MSRTCFLPLVLLVLIAAITVRGETLGSKRDAQGCLTSAGYSWCEHLSRCVRHWETPCHPHNQKCEKPGESWCEPKQRCINEKVEGACVSVEDKKPRMIGGARDVKGCLGPAGYEWCESQKKCMRRWEEECRVVAATDCPIGNHWCDTQKKCVSAHVKCE